MLCNKKLLKTECLSINLTSSLPDNNETTQVVI